MTDLKGKVAVVLGASAERGTGWGIAEDLAGRGVKVVVAARSFEPLQKLAAKTGGIAVCCDGGSEADIKSLAASALKEYGRIDIAINCAATPTLGLISESTPEMLQQAIQVNFFGMTYFVREMAAAMREGGSIVLISSLSAVSPLMPHFSYACAKAATECLVRYAAQEYGPRQIRVNGVRIGTVYSDMAAEHYDTPGVGERFIAEIPLGRMGQPADMAEVVAMLAGPVYMTGSTLDVSGGNHLHRFPFLDELPGAGASYEGAGALYDREHGKGYTFKSD